MRLYLDEDSVNTLLIRLLRLAGHDVIIPTDVGKSGENDPVQLRVAILEQRTLLTGNNDDFEELHDLLMAGQGHHFGIFVVCKENDSTRDMKPANIVRAVANVI